MMRVSLFLLTNLAVITLFGLLLKLGGLQSSNVHFLLITALIFGFSGSFFSLIMSKWIALKSVNGEIINKQPRNDIECWLIDTVSQQAKKTGITMPQVAIYHAPDINAFATGAHQNSSLVAVSSGLLQNLSKDEAEAVIAHEISHIVNGDMVTMTLIQGVMNTFVIFISRLLAQVITVSLSGNQEEQNEEKDNKNDSLVYLSIATVLEIIFGILASIITMWFSRYREFLADAGSAKLVGKEKMISALQRLKVSHEPQEEANIMTFCINGRSSSFGELFMTHPSLDKRIKALRRGDYISKVTD